MEVGRKNCIAIGIKCKVAKRVGHHLYDMKVESVECVVESWIPGNWLESPCRAGDSGHWPEWGHHHQSSPSQTRFIFCNSTWLNSIDLDCTNFLWILWYIFNCIRCLRVTTAMSFHHHHHSPPPPLFRTLTNKISIVKLREREGHRVDPGRSLKGAKVFKGR